MTIDEYFGYWLELLDRNAVNSIMQRLYPLRQSLCPDLRHVFHAFRLRPLDDRLSVVFIGQDPYPTWRNGHPVATGLAFANSSDTAETFYSPSLKVLRDSLINFSVSGSHVNFDPSLESWEEQGVLLLNASLTCLRDRPKSHMLLWRPFMTDFCETMSMYNPQLVYVLMGADAQSLRYYIDEVHNHIICCRHPSWYARNHEMLPDIWSEINNCLIGWSRTPIDWFSVKQ